MQVILCLGSIFGNAILVHFSWLLIFALVTFSLVAQLAGQFPRLQAIQVSIGMTASLLFLSSVLFHKLVLFFGAIWYVSQTSWPVVSSAAG